MKYCSICEQGPVYDVVVSVEGKYAHSSCYDSAKNFGDAIGPSVDIEKYWQQYTSLVTKGQTRRGKHGKIHQQDLACSGVFAVPDDEWEMIDKISVNDIKTNPNKYCRNCFGGWMR